MLAEFDALAQTGRPVTARMFIGGRWSGRPADTHSVESPADESAIATTPAGGVAACAGDPRNLFPWRFRPPDVV